jgi:hypothetical protein
MVRAQLEPFTNDDGRRRVVVQGQRGTATIGATWSTAPGSPNQITNDAINGTS